MMTRTLIAGLLVALGVGSAVAQETNCFLPPPDLRAEPNVPYAVRVTPGAEHYCHGTQACSGQYAPGKWVIYIDADASDSLQKCMLAHEKGHLPPNLWSPGHRGRLPGMAQWNPNRPRPAFTRQVASSSGG
jgi:hypothetical protein